MPKVTIDVDLGELEGDWEAVGFRVPKVSDMHLDVFGRIARCSDPDCTQPRLIVRRKTKWPSWCKAVAICKDKNGQVYSFAGIPVRADDVWAPGVHSYHRLDPNLVDFQLPDDWDWTVPFLNPNYQEPSGS